MAGSECISYGVLTSMDKVKAGLAPVKQATDKAGVLLGEGRHEGMKASLIWSITIMNIFKRVK
jgi:hypothetical protein